MPGLVAAIPPPHNADTRFETTRLANDWPMLRSAFHLQRDPMRGPIRGFAIVAATMLILAGSTARAQQGAPETRPYDDRLMRLSEVLGAIHFLRELCGGNDGMQWRERMRELMDTEGSSALRRSKLTRAFNLGYRSYSRTYSTCTPSAQTAISRFLNEGVEIADALVKSVP